MAPVRILLVDNHDSFTYNLFALLTEAAGIEPVVLDGDAELPERLDARFDAVVLSPGPGRPDHERDFRAGRAVLERTELPVLGVCLGHQGLVLAEGGRVERVEPVHGQIDEITHSGTGLFAGLPDPLPVVRYHSLAATEIPESLQVIARSADGLVMAVQHTSKPRWGVQFHPESISSAGGRALAANFVRLAREARATPSVRVLDFAADLPAFVGALAARDDAPLAWLDREAAAQGERQSIVAFGGEYLGYDVEQAEFDLFDELDARLHARRLRSPREAGTAPTDFALGAVGYLGYELKALVGSPGRHRAPTPDAALLFASRAVVVDHEVGQTFVLVEPGDEAALPGIVEALAPQASAPSASVRAQGPSARFTLTPRLEHEGYLEAIEAAQGFIRAGESYEVCLTNQLSGPAPSDPLRTFLVMRRQGPTPYAAYLRFPGVTVLSASPERFLRVRDEGARLAVDAKPIKGTRPRSSDPARDAALRAELADAVKDRAENLMIVDLTRNDLTRVCDPASVQVAELYGIETYSTVHQMVSTVRGTLLPGRSAVDAVRAAFPGGSMTGAPKLRTMELIDELEPVARGVYSGALGMFSYDGSADLSIVIRTLVVADGRATYGTGGAITALSDPEDEWAETVVKATAAQQALAPELSS